MRMRAGETSVAHGAKLSQDEALLPECVSVLGAGGLLGPFNAQHLLFNSNLSFKEIFFQWKLKKMPDSLLFPPFVWKKAFIDYFPV